MRIPKDCQILKAASEDASRLAIMGAQFDAEKKTLTATDRRILCSIKVETDDGDVSGVIPPEAIKEAFKLSKTKPWRALPPTILGVEPAPGAGQRMVKLLDGRQFPMMDVKFPVWGPVLPQIDHARRRVARLWIDPELLLKVAQAAGRTDEKGNMGAVLEFELDSEDDAAPKPIRVTAGRGDAVHAVLMPMKLGSRAPNRIDDADKAQEEYGKTVKEKAR